MKKQISLFALAAAVLTVPVLAAPGGGKMGDANGDGVITRSEAQTAATQMFSKMDVNKDGKLDKADRAAHQAERQEKRFTAMDTDSNGAISRAEWDAHSADRQAKRADRRGNRGEATGEKGKRGGHSMRGHRGKGGHHGMMGMMMKADTNGDKAISPAEFQAAAMARFDAADANKDGQVTAEERKAAHEALRAERGARHGSDGQ